jgi:hypothetical protein
LGKKGKEEWDRGGITFSCMKVAKRKDLPERAFSLFHHLLAGHPITQRFIGAFIFSLQKIENGKILAQPLLFKKTSHGSDDSIDKFLHDQSSQPKG